MTTEEAKILQNGGIITPQRIELPKSVNRCCPTPKVAFPEGQPKQLTQEDYNAIPLADMVASHKYHNMDELHRADAAAEEFNYGTKLNSIHRAVGKDKFLQFLKNKNNQKNN